MGLTPVAGMNPADSLYAKWGSKPTDLGAEGRRSAMAGLPIAMPDLDTALKRLGFRAPQEVKPVSGGSISPAYRVQTEGRPFFLKTAPRSSTLRFETEARSLDRLREATSLVIPRVVGASDPIPDEPGFLCLEYLVEAGSGGGKKQHRRLGSGLAELHRVTSEQFGLTEPTFCGPTVQDNRWLSDWPGFYRTQRLLPLVDALSLGAQDRGAVDRFLQRLPELLSPGEPSLIHGDLWPGNVLFSDRGPALIDPALSFSHREAELGMMTLFGGFSPETFESYEADFPLEPGWRDRNPIYQLYHILNHAVLFGGAYVHQAMQVIRRFSSSKV